MDNIDCIEMVTQRTLGQVRSFLDQLSNGISNYRSMHNLTEQVEHQYHGRFVIETIQNAHDALLDEEAHDGCLGVERGRIAIVVSDEAPYGAMYIANDGEPFQESNFKSLSSFGESDKNPEKHIGNKGIGFRSVLEISRAPEVFSRRDRDGKSFDGFCFRFDPRVADHLRGPISELLHGNDSPILPLCRGALLVDWGERRLSSLRSRCESMSADGLDEELAMLSPYLLPVALSRQDRTPLVQQFEDEGYATVLRLPFLSEEAKELAVNKLGELDARTMLFLRKAKSLRIEIDEVSRTINRNTSPLAGMGGALQVVISSTSNNSQNTESDSYWYWEWEVGGDANSDELKEIQEAAACLPGKWPEINKVDISLAVRISDVPDEGLISIFLPTEQPSGVACHLNAPFYGDISRTDIDFGQPFNQLVREKMASRAAEIILDHLIGKGVDEARAVLDIIAPVSSEDEHGEEWLELLKLEFLKRHANITQASILKTSDGWESIKNARLLPEYADGTIVSRERLYENAAYHVIHESLCSREAQIERLYALVHQGMLGFATRPNEEDVAETIECIALQLHSDGDSDWNNFWSDVMALLPDSSSLIDHKLILGKDEDLHAAGKHKSIFFRPRGVSDGAETDEEINSRHEIDHLPEELTSRIAFLHESITIHMPREGGGIKNHPLHDYLASSLVQPYVTQEIIRTVLVPAVPELPLSLASKESALCRAIIGFGVQLVSRLAVEDKGDRAVQLLGDLPVPCKGGWHYLKETSFGAGWDRTVGSDLDVYLSAVSSADAKDYYDRLLLPQSDEHWGAARSVSVKLLEQAGVLDGLRLSLVPSDSWSSKLSISRQSGVHLPESPPKGFSQEFWKLLDAMVSKEKPYFESRQAYRVEGLYVIPGMDGYAKLDVNASISFMNVILNSIEEWPMDWASTRLVKVNKQRHHYQLESPLKFWLSQTPWLLDIAEPLSKYRPSDRWFIAPALLSARGHDFTHLAPVPPPLALQLEKNVDLLDQLEELGMPRYDPEQETSSSLLLEKLASILESDIAISNKDVFKGQVRDAWRVYSPEPDDMLPEKLIVKSGSDLKWITPSEAGLVLIIDEMSKFMYTYGSCSENILVIDPSDARRLKHSFKSTFGPNVRFASEVRHEPMVDGELWEGMPEGDLLYDSALEWIVPVLLCCHAHAGTQLRGTGTKAYSRAMDALRSARILWVDDLQIKEVSGGENSEATSVDGIWLSSKHTMLASSSSQKCLGRLAEAFSSLLSRADLDVPLRLVLNRFDSINQPEDKVIEDALLELKISPDHLAEVKQLRLGDLAWTIQLLRPALTVLVPDKDVSDVLSVTTQEGLESYLSQLNIEGISPSRLLATVEKSKSFTDFGRTLHAVLCSEFELEAWNKALLDCGEQQVVNEDYTSQFNAHLEASKRYLHSILLDSARQGLIEGSFLDLIRPLDELCVPSECRMLYWELPFEVAMAEVAPVLESWNVSAEQCASIASEASLIDLSRSIGDSENPMEIREANRSSCLRLLRSIRRAGIIWCSNNQVSADLWGQDEQDLFSKMGDSWEMEGWKGYWSDSHIFELLSKLSILSNMSVFRDALASVDSIEALLDVLGVPESLLDSADEELQRVRNSVEKAKRTLDVCGDEFENSESSLYRLYEHVENNIKEESIEDIELTGADLLAPINKAPRQTHGSTKMERRQKPKGRISDRKKQLIGYAGEIHTYRLLKKKYGSDVVRPDSWVSELSLHKYPDNRVSDGFGCDFRFIIDGVEHFVEVKATEGDDNVFRLGPSEVGKAIEVAGKRRKKYLIMHIANALSKHPKHRILHNPFDSRYEHLYQAVGDGLQIRYSPNDGPQNSNL